MNFTQQQNKPKFLFVNLPYDRLRRFTKQSISLGLLSIAIVLCRNGHKVEINDVDTSFSDESIEYSTKNRVAVHENFVSNLHNENYRAWPEFKEITIEENSD